MNRKNYLPFFVLFLTIVIALLLIFLKDSKKLPFIDEDRLYENIYLKRNHTGVKSVRVDNEENLTLVENKSYNFSFSKTLEEMKNYTKIENVRFVGICSGKFFDVISVSEGVSKCINKESPYIIEIEIGNETLIAKIIDEKGFDEVYDLNETLLLFYLFAEDLAIIRNEIEKFELEGSEFFILDNYTLYTIWGQDKQGNLIIDKMIVALPLYINSEKVLEQKYDLKFYMRVFNEKIYLGQVVIKLKKEK